MLTQILPPEVLHEIIRLSPKSAQLALCRTSHLFRSLATRSLYVNVSLDTSSSLMQLCTTLRSNLTAAASVKCLSISYIPTEPPNTVYLASYYRNFKSALLKLTNLQDFRLLVFDPHFTNSLFSTTTPQLYFPSLRHFETYLPLTIPLLNFIERHSKIVYLEVSHYEKVSLERTTSRCYERCWIPRKPTLLNLNHFAGNSVYLTSLTPAAPLPIRSASLFWDATQECQGPIMALAQASSETLNVLTCRRRGWNVDLICHIASHLSDIYVLHIVNVLVLDDHLSQVFRDEVAQHLSRFRRLQRLKITREMQWCPSEVVCDLDRELSIVEIWGAACPSLSTITLPHSEHNIEWCRVTDNVWVPVDVPPSVLARGWLRDSARVHKHPRTFKSFKQLENYFLCPLPPL